MYGGPKPMERGRRLRLAYQIAERVHRHYRSHAVALGVYGSVARGSDGPYSDIEMHCIVRGRDFATAHEWTVGAWKAEVDVYTEDVILRWATTVDVDWPLTHGAFTKVLSLYDPGDFFSRLRVTVLSQPQQPFRQAMHDVIVGELYERIGKVRNARASKNLGRLPYLAVELAKFGACLIGLTNRHLYTSSSGFLEESLALPDRPEGYDALCKLVLTGKLTPAAQVSGAADALWAGIEKWTREHGITIEEELETVLGLKPQPPAL